MLWVIWTVVATVALLALHCRYTRAKFHKRGVKTETMVPLFGSIARVALKMEHIIDNVNKTYFKFPGERFVVRFEFLRPVVFVRDLELIKKITVKDFEHFTDHRLFASSDPVVAKNLFSLRGTEWKNMRRALSPLFTGSKLRMMILFMVEVGDRMILNITKTLRESESNYLDMDVRDLTNRFANDVIASCAFGLKVDSHSDRDNEFYTQGLTATNFKFRQQMTYMISSSATWLSPLLRLKFFGNETANFFRHLMLSALNEREKHNIFRPDMINLLMEIKKGKLFYEKTESQDEQSSISESFDKDKTVNRVWKEDDLFAQVMFFFTAGFLPTSTFLSLMFYELALNPDIQNRLVDEIREADVATGGKIDFDVIQQMKYMDMVVSEVVRKWTTSMLDRICTRDYNLGKANDDATEDYIIRKGEGLQIPVWAIHRNPEYFPDPDRFDPERFSDENKHNIKPFTYISFGSGPRNCIGSRFALNEMKVMAYQLLRHVVVSPCPRTPMHSQIDPNFLSITLKGGHWLRLSLRR